jgi:hypothetical protein
MEKLPEDKQAEIRKMASERMMLWLVKAGCEPDSITELDRHSLLNQYAEFVLAGEPDKWPAAENNEISSPTGETNFNVQMKMFELEMMRLQAEREERELTRLRLEKEREDRLWREELEREERLRREELEREERLRREALEKQRLDLERERLEAERELRLKEIRLKEDELARLALRDKQDGERKQSLASRTEFYGEAMKNVLWKFPQDPRIRQRFPDILNTSKTCLLCMRLTMM